MAAVCEPVVFQVRENLCRGLGAQKLFSHRHPFDADALSRVWILPRALLTNLARAIRRSDESTTNPAKRIWNLEAELARRASKNLRIGILHCGTAVRGAEEQEGWQNRESHGARAMRLTRNRRKFAEKGESVSP